MVRNYERAKRVTDPLDETMKARLVGLDRYQVMSYASSGSEHDGGVDDDSPCLSDLVQSFLEEDDNDDDELVVESHSHSDRVDSDAESTDVIERMLHLTVTDNADPVRNILLSHVLKAASIFSCLSSNKSMFGRNVMTYLRNLGCNAAICKAKWEKSGGLSAGNHEYIDVVIVTSQTQNRYLIDLDFAGEFEIARPTAQYASLVQTLPRVLVGKEGELKKIVKLMCDAAKKSLKSNELQFPPWRKSRYMLMKWFGPYCRTTALIPTAQTAPAAQSAVKCRSVGFNTGVNGRYSAHTRLI